MARTEIVNSDFFLFASQPNRPFATVGHVTDNF